MLIRYCVNILLVENTNLYKYRVTNRRLTNSENLTSSTLSPKNQLFSFYTSLICQSQESSAIFYLALGEDCLNYFISMINYFRFKRIEYCLIGRNYQLSAKLKSVVLFKNIN